MQIYTHWTGVDASDRGTAAVIGNFDGVHIGHQAVMDIARGLGPLSVVTFEPHPRQVFAPHAPPFRLMNAEAKANRLEKLGVQALFQLPFGPDLSRLTPQEFCRDVITDGLGLRHVVVGADFCFGKARAGNAETLRECGKTMGFDVTAVPLIATGGIEVSSTNIRQALTDGAPQKAAEMLGHWHRIEGPVIHGEKRGRDLGFPTANMAIDGLHPPKFGVYAVKVDVLTGPHQGEYHGAASLGVRPMFGENRANLETFIFDFQGDLYGAHLSVALVDYLRPELKFDGLDALITQMDADCARAREILG